MGGAKMAVASMSTVYDDLVESILDWASPEQILAFKVSPARQARVEALIEKLKAEALTADERQELEQIRQFDRLVGVLKARAQAASHPK
jgi:hypothetical protein